ncbi:EpsG family protein [Avibacterium avium]|uniref:Transmembrane protein EpsG n=1 Tax=Avibacterium avium TaxID=751 RepID=A0A379AR19_AVIAV|nr:Uncharacterised protein [Avibacterium avium]
MTILISMYLICFFGFVFPKSKTIFYLQIISSLIIFGGYDGDLDLNFYREQYNSNYLPSSIFQKLFSYLLIAFSYYDIPFYIVHFFIVLLSIVLISIVIYKLTDYIAYALSIVLLFPFFENGWQLKSCIAMGVITLALYWFYINIFNKKISLLNSLIYVGLLYIASQFHYMSVFFLSFLLINIKSNNLLFFIFLIDLFIFCYSKTIINYFSQYMPSLEAYTTPISIISFLTVSLWQIIGTIIVYFNRQENNNKFNQFILKGSFIMLLLLPFYEFSLITMRLYKIWIIFMGISISYNLYFTKSRLKTQAYFFSIYIIFSHMFFYILLPYILNKDLLPIVLFNDNFFISSLKN